MVLANRVLSGMQVEDVGEHYRVDLIKNIKGCGGSVLNRAYFLPEIFSAIPLRSCQLSSSLWRVVVRLPDRHVYYSVC